MFAQIVRFTQAPCDIPEQERDQWIGLTVPTTEFCDCPNGPCFTTAGVLYQALQLAGMDRAAARHSTSSPSDKILIDPDYIEVIDPQPVFWANVPGRTTLHRLPKLIPSYRRLDCGRVTRRTEELALSPHWYDILRVHPFVLVTHEVGLEMGDAGHVHLCGNCLRADRLRSNNAPAA